jgi:arylsulfatase A
VRTGAAAPSFDAIDCLPTVEQKAISFLISHGKQRGDGGAGQEPFFLYVALPAPHTPLVPSPAWQGKSPLGPYADYVMETDDVVGKILQAVRAAGLSDSTIVYFTSDNGCAPYIGVKALEAKGHFPSAQFRGYKADIWEGGHRIPLVVRWPGVVAAGSTYDETVSLSDLMATTAQIVGYSLPQNGGEDSVSMLPALQGGTQPLREAEIQHSIDGNFAIREGKWKLELCAGSGGWSAPREPAAHKQGLPPVQLYDLSADIGETTNVEGQHPEVVAAMETLLKKYIDDGRSTPGAPQKNDVPIDIWKLSNTAETGAAIGD